MADPIKSSLFNTTGIPEPGDACVVLVKTSWNEAIVNELERGCIEVLREHGIEDIRQAEVPGSFELPFAIRHYWHASKQLKRPAAFIALGAVIRGGTPHFEYVSQAVTQGILQLNLELPVPTIFGVLTLDNEQQALERIGGTHGHKGKEAALTALKMIGYMRTV